jgi:hypothetical protein
MLDGESIPVPFLMVSDDAGGVEKVEKGTFGTDLLL